jgi:hypothetical protein
MLSGIPAAAAKDNERAAAPRSFTAISPIFGELVAFSMPATFKVAYENTNGAQYIREAVLNGETVDVWSQMITVTGTKGAANAIASPQAYAANIAAGFKNACPETFFAKGLREMKVGGHDAFVAIASCGKVDDSADKHSETALIVAIKGTADLYTVQWAERAPASAENLTVDDAKWNKRLEALAPIKLCPIVEGEQAPFPSCIGSN